MSVVLQLTMGLTRAPLSIALSAGVTGRSTLMDAMQDLPGSKSRTHAASNASAVDSESLLDRAETTKSAVHSVFAASFLLSPV